MLKKTLILSLLSVCLLQSLGYCEVYDDFSEDGNVIAGRKYYSNGQYSSAIKELKTALRNNPKNYPARTLLINSYISRAQYYNNTAQDTTHAISDLKSALFYFDNFPNETGKSYTAAYTSAVQNLKELEAQTRADVSASGRIQSAKAQRAFGEFAAAGYDYSVAAKDKRFAKEANEGLGDIMKIFGLDNVASNYYERAVLSAQNDSGLHLKLANSQERSGNYDDALKNYNFALQNSDEKDEILNSLEKICRQRAEAAPYDAWAHFNLGTVYQKRKDYQSALAQYEKALSLKPGDSMIKLQQAALFEEQNEFSKALSICNSVLMAEPLNTEAKIQKAKCLSGLKNYDGAITLYKEILMKNPGDKSAIEGLASITSLRGSYSDLIADLKTIPGFTPSAELTLSAAEECYRSGNSDNALKYYLETLKIDPNNQIAYINIIQIYANTGKIAQAQAYLSTLKAKFPQDTHVKELEKNLNLKIAADSFEEAQNLFAQKKYSEALGFYLKINPQTRDSLNGAANCYAAMNNSSKALEYYKKSLSLNPDDKDVLLAVAGIYANEENTKEAKEYLTKVLKISPNDKKASELKDHIRMTEYEYELQKAVKVFNSENYPEAEKLFTNIISIWNSDYLPYYYRGLIYENTDKPEKAIKDYEKAVSLNPNETIIFYLLATNYDGLNNKQKAVENYKKFLSVSTESTEYTEYAKDRLKELN